MFVKKKDNDNELGVMSRHTRYVESPSKGIRRNEKMVESRLKCFGYLWRRYVESPSKGIGLDGG